MNIWLQIIAIPCMVTIIVNHGTNPIADWLGIKLKKPLNCAFCLSFWCSFGIFVYQFGAVGVLYSAISTAIAAQIKWT